MSPEDAAPQPEIEDLVERFLDEGVRDVEAFARRFPSRADELRRILPGVLALEAAGGTFGSEEERSRLHSLRGWRALRERLRDGATLSAAQPPDAAPSHEARVAQALARVEASDAFERRYRTEGELARGGQGTILLVRDVKLGRHLAMKVALLRADEPGSETRSLGRFLDEASVTARLDHPGIVPVHDLGLDHERRAYFTMKLVKGRDLWAVFELVARNEDGWTRTRTLGVLLKVCEAMSYAHSRGVIHRDLKPSNVMVGRFGEVYVMDWGLARVLGTPETNAIPVHAPDGADRGTELPNASPPLTRDGDLLGTPAYMSPEQARGDLAAMGPASDVYAVGAMLYHLLSGQAPYTLDGTRPGPLEVWARVRQGPPAALSQRARDVPSELVAICEKAMAREPGARYADMQALGEDLRAYLENRVVRAYEAGALPELRKWVARNRGLAASLAAAVVLALGGLGGIGYVQARGKRTAAAERDNVLRLSALQELEELQREADQLWPPSPELEDEYTTWLQRADELVAGLERSPEGTPGHRARRAKLEARALPYSAAQHERERASDPRFALLNRKRAELAAREQAQTVREGKREVERVELDKAAREAEVLALSARAIERIYTERTLFGEEALGLALARELVTREVENAYDRADYLDTLAWACYANGLDAEAVEASQRALAAAPASHTVDFELRLRNLKIQIAAPKDEVLARLREEILGLEQALSARLSWDFPRREDRWWHTQLVKLIEELEAFAHPETGLVDGLSREHGWGIRRRAAWAREVDDLTLRGAAGELWKEALVSIADKRICPAYGGLRIEPQLGLVPLGRDPASGLWEFADLATGAAPLRDAGGRLVVTEDTGLVFVLLPGGTFRMGGQSRDPTQPNHDPAATEEHGPVHEVTLSPFFLSKYELTQAQWLRLTGHNPSRAQPPFDRERRETIGRGGNWVEDLTHPVEQVSWVEALRASERIGLTLPSEAQWEYAARAGTSTRWWSGDERDSLLGAVNLADRAAARVGAVWPVDDWVALDDGYVVHAPVGRLRPNPFGLHDVVGNVWEWCLDAYDHAFYHLSPSVDPVCRGSSDQRMNRGASFRNAATSGRSSLRSWTSKEASTPECGLRPARALGGAVRSGT